MQSEQSGQTVKLPVMVTVQGKSIAVEHVIGIEHYALESHGTLLMHTTVGSFMLHDEVAADVAVFFGLRKAKAPEAGVVELRKKKG